jgi:hypothetical protein
MDKGIRDSYTLKTENLALTFLNPQIASPPLAGGEEGEGGWFEELTTLVLRLSKDHPHPPPSKGEGMKRAYS